MVTVRVDVDQLNIRTGPGTAYSVDHIAKRSDTFNVDPSTLIMGFVSVGASLWAAWQYLKPVPQGTSAVTVNTDVLNIRRGPGTNYPIAGQLKRGAVVPVDLSLTKGNWWRIAVPDEQWISGQYVVTGSIPLPPAQPPVSSGKIFGINLDPMNPTANPPASALSGVGWVRFVFHANRGLDVAYAFYDPLIRAWTAAGIKVLLILLQDTYWGSGPWNNTNNWPGYAVEFGAVAGKIAAHYRGQVAGYEIWNEMDSPGQPTSIYIPPQTYGVLLTAASKAIRSSDPSAKVVSGGMSGSDPTGYIRAVKQAIGGALPVDAVGFHPYGKTPPNTVVFDWPMNTLKLALQQLHDAINMPIWITEIGVARVDVNNQSYWPTIGTYMRNTFKLIHDQLSNICPVLIWFAWSDSQDSAGIVHDNQQHKGAIWDAFTANVHDDTENPKPADPAEPSPDQPTTEKDSPLGIHIETTGGVSADLLNTATRLHNAGKPWGLVVVINDVGLANAMVQVCRNVIFRDYAAGKTFNIANLTSEAAAQAEANKVWASHQSSIAKLDKRIWIQTRCETGSTPFDWAYECRIMDLAKTQGRHVVIYGDSPGTPELNEYQWRIPALRQAMRDGHALSLHEYSAFIDKKPSDTPLCDVASRSSYGLRHRMLYASVPADCRPKLFNSETGLSTVHMDSIEDIEGYCNLLNEDAYVDGMAIYGYGASMYNLNGQLAALEQLRMRQN